MWILSLVGVILLVISIVLYILKSPPSVSKTPWYVYALFGFSILILIIAFSIELDHFKSKGEIDTLDVIMTHRLKVVMSLFRACLVTP